MDLGIAGRHAINVRGSGDVRLLRTTVQGGKTAIRIVDVLGQVLAHRCRPTHHSP